MRDVSDYGASELGSAASGSNPFNIKEAAVRLRPFTHEEIHELYSQHTSDTGQAFAADAVDLADRRTAIARERLGAGGHGGARARPARVP